MQYFLLTQIFSIGIIILVVVNLNPKLIIMIVPSMSCVEIAREFILDYKRYWSRITDSQFKDGR
jgi:hypothetical protein